MRPAVYLQYYMLGMGLKKWLSLFMIQAINRLTSDILRSYIMAPAYIALTWSHTLISQPHPTQLWAVLMTPKYNETVLEYCPQLVSSISYTSNDDDDPITKLLNVSTRKWCMDI